MTVLYGVVALGPLVDVALLSHPPWLPTAVGALLGVVALAGYRVWRSLDHAIRVFWFALLAIATTVLSRIVLLDPLPDLRGSTGLLVDLGLVTVGSLAVTLAMTWYLTTDPS